MVLLLCRGLRRDGFPVIRLFVWNFSRKGKSDAGLPPGGLERCSVCFFKFYRVLEHFTLEMLTRICRQILAVKQA
jgi:hypothetical protein